MVYLKNTTEYQQVYIERQAYQTATTREVINITTGDVINIVNSSLTEYSTTEEVEGMISAATDGMATQEWVNEQGFLTENSLSAYSTTQEIEEMISGITEGFATQEYVDNSIAAESARCENTYAKPSDIPDVSDFVTSAQVETQITEKGYATEQWVEDKHYLTEHQSLSAYTPTSGFATINGSAITEGGDLIIEGGGATYSAGANIDISEDNVISVTGISDFVTSAQVETQITEKGYTTSGNVDTAINDAIASESARCENSYAKKADIPDVSDFVTSAQVETQITEKGYITSDALNGYATEQYVDSSIASESARTESTYAKPADIPDVSDFVTSADVKTQIEDYHYITSGALEGYATEQYVDNSIAAESARCENTYIKEHQSLAGLFDSVNYVSSAKTINFYDKENTLVGTVDATDFIKDGMVDNVFISGESLYIVFNTDAGKETIELDLTQIFDADNYYNKTEVDGLFAAESARTENVYAKKTEIPDVSDFVTSADVKTQIEGYNYATSGNVDTAISDAMAAETARTENTYAKPADIPDVTNFVTSAQVETQITDKGYITSDALNGYATEQYVDNSIAAESARCENTYAKPSDIPDVSDFVTSAQVETQITNKGYTTSGNVDTAISDAINTESARTENVYAKKTDIPDVSDFVTSAQVETQITEKGYVTSGNVDTAISNAMAAESARTESTYLKEHQSLSAYTPTSGFATINGSAITEGGDLIIEGGSSSGVVIVELTKAEYSALTAYTEDTIYNITDADSVDMDDYALSADVVTISGYLETAISNKVDKINTTASSTSGRWPHWNSQGQVTGYTSASTRNVQINGNQYGVYSSSSSDIPMIYAPATVGDAGQPLISNGIGAPVWASFKFWFGTKSQYDAISVKDNSTIYFVKPDNN